MTFVLTIHSIVRWLTVLVAAVLIVKFTLGWLKRQPFDKAARALSGAFGGLMDTQLLLGLIFFIWNGSLIEGGFALRQRWEHLGVMLIAVIVAHLSAMWKKKDDTTRYRNTLITVLVSLALIILGVTALSGNRWLHIKGLF